MFNFNTPPIYVRILFSLNCVIHCVSTFYCTGTSISTPFLIDIRICVQIFGSELFGQTCVLSNETKIWVMENCFHIMVLGLLKVSVQAIRTEPERRLTQIIKKNIQCSLYENIAIISNLNKENSINNFGYFFNFPTNSHQIRCSTSILPIETGFLFSFPVLEKQNLDRKKNNSFLQIELESNELSVKPVTFW